MEEEEEEEEGDLGLVFFFFFFFSFFFLLLLLLLLTLLLLLGSSINFPQIMTANWRIAGLKYDCLVLCLWRSCSFNLFFGFLFYSELRSRFFFYYKNFQVLLFIIVAINGGFNF